MDFNISNITSATFFPYEGQVVRWYADSPEPGAPNCFCLFCSQLIGANEKPVRFVIVYPEDREARFHSGCFPLVDPKHFQGREPVG